MFGFVKSLFKGDGGETDLMLALEHYLKHCLAHCFAAGYVEGLGDPPELARAEAAAAANSHIDFDPSIALFIWVLVQSTRGKLGLPEDSSMDGGVTAVLLQDCIHLEESLAMQLARQAAETSPTAYARVQEALDAEDPHRLDGDQDAVAVVGGLAAAEEVLSQYKLGGKTKPVPSDTTMEKFRECFAD